MAGDIVDGFALDVLREIFYNGDGRSLPMSELEVLTGKSPSELRPHLEDLKSGQYIIENRNAFEISPTGRHFGRSRWV